MRHPLRIVDANGNRAAEGLRVLEDVARFLLDDATLGETAKTLRHAVRSAIPAHAVAERDTAGDVGTAITAPGEMERADVVALVRANAARVAEALRAGEEAAKLAGLGATAAALENARYGTYRLESAVLARLPAWRLAHIRLYALVDTELTDDVVTVAAAVAKGGAGIVQLRAKRLGLRAYRELSLRVQEAVRAHGALFAVNDHVAVARAIGADAIHVGQDDLDVADTRAVVGPLCAVGLSCHSAAQVEAALILENTFDVRRSTFDVERHRDTTSGPFTQQMNPHNVRSSGNLTSNVEARSLPTGGRRTSNVPSRLIQRPDYLGLGPMFATSTKPHEPQRGPELLDAVAERLRTVALPSYAIGGIDAARLRSLKPRLPHGVAVAAALCRAADPQRAAEELCAILEKD